MGMVSISAGLMQDRPLSGHDILESAARRHPAAEVRRADAVPPGATGRIDEKRIRAHVCGMAE